VTCEVFDGRDQNSREARICQMLQKPMVQRLMQARPVADF
jgi:hypothetical protein